MLTSAQFAAHFKVPYTTAVYWLQKGKVPGAKLVDAPRGAVWEIPVSALQTFTPPKPGRPTKDKAAKKATKKGKK